MEPLIALLAAIVGYFLGAVSFARVVTRLAAPGKELGKIKVYAPDSDAGIESDSISATTVRMQVGARYGCLVGILDMLKAAAPALAFRWLYPGAPYDLIAAGMAVVGHNFPIYYRFQGGRGLSPVLGGFLTLDWIGTLLTNLAGFLIGLPSRNSVIMTGGGIVLMIPWVWFRTGEPAELAYVVIMNLLYWSAMIPELKEFARLIREGKIEDFKHARRLRVVLPDGTERYDTATLGGLLDRLKIRTSRKPEEPRDGTK